MEKQKDNKGFVENEEFENAMTDLEVDEFVEKYHDQYEPFYDDVKAVRLDAGHRISAEEQADIFNAAIETFGKRQGLLFFTDFDRRHRILILFSKKFKEILDKMKKGTRVKFTSPYDPDINEFAVVQSDGVRYEGGVPVFDLLTEPKHCIDGDHFFLDQGPYFALYWRPVEEEK